MTAMLMRRCPSSRISRRVAVRRSISTGSPVAGAIAKNATNVLLGNSSSIAWARARNSASYLIPVRSLSILPDRSPLALARHRRCPWRRHNQGIPIHTVRQSGRQECPRKTEKPEAEK